MFGIGFLYAAATRLGLSAVSALLAVLLYLSSPWTTKMLFLTPWITDGLFYAMVCAALWASATRNAVFLIILTLTGVFVRETALLFPILFVLVGLFSGEKFRARIVPMAITCLAGFAVVLAIQKAIPAWNSDAGYLRTLPSQALLYFDKEATDPYEAALSVPTARHEVIVYTVAWRLAHLNAPS